MPDRQRHRGPHPDDGRLFAPDQLPALRSAVADLSWLMSRSYAQPSALQLVGNRYQLTGRQRTCVMRCACSDEQLRHREDASVDPAQLASRPLAIDGYNLLTTVEAALAGGLLIVGRDGAMRDLASMHGSWRRVDETEAALILIGKTLENLRVEHAHWLLDKPVSNSGRLAGMMRDMALAQGWAWQVTLVDDADSALAEAGEIVASADSVVIDRSARWVSLARVIVGAQLHEAWVIDFREAPQR